MRLYLPILAVFLCVLLDALANLPSGADYYGRIKDTTPVVTNAWQSVQKDVEGLVDAKISGATNAVAETVASIVTNETTVGWRWELHPDFVSATDPVFEAWYLPDGSFGGASWNAVFTMRDGYQMLGSVPCEERHANRDVVPFEQGTAYRIKGNALGLAMAKDLEQLPTHETVTNIVRDNIGSVWDDQLGVAWQARMHNGHLYYIAVTNQPTGGK